MLRYVPRWLVTAVSVVVLSTAGGEVALAQEGEETLKAVCVQGFEDPIHVEYLTDAQIADIDGLEQDPSEPPVPQTVGYPDPATGSCATENGELMEYDPEITTPICVSAGPRGETLVVQFVANHYLTAYDNVILADPETGACPDQDVAETPSDDSVTTGDEVTGQNGSDSDTDTTGASTTSGSETVETTALPKTGTGAVVTQTNRHLVEAGLLLSTLVLAGAGHFLVRARLR